MDINAVLMCLLKCKTHYALNTIKIHLYLTISYTKYSAIKLDLNRFYLFIRCLSLILQARLMEKKFV